MWEALLWSTEKGSLLPLSAVGAEGSSSSSLCLPGTGNGRLLPVPGQTGQPPICTNICPGLLSHSRLLHKCSVFTRNQGRQGPWQLPAVISSAPFQVTKAAPHTQGCCLLLLLLLPSPPWGLQSKGEALPLPDKLARTAGELSGSSGVLSLSKEVPEPSPLPDLASWDAGSKDGKGHKRKGQALGTKELLMFICSAPKALLCSL